MVIVDLFDIIGMVFFLLFVILVSLPTIKQFFGGDK